MKPIGVTVDEWAIKYGIDLDVLSCQKCLKKQAWTDIEGIAGYRCILSEPCECGVRIARCVPVGDVSKPLSFEDCEKALEKLINTVPEPPPKVITPQEHERLKKLREKKKEKP